jgi:hypothetical protein
MPETVPNADRTFGPDDVEEPQPEAPAPEEGGNTENDDETWEVDSSGTVRLPEDER